MDIEAGVCGVETEHALGILIEDTGDGGGNDLHAVNKGIHRILIHHDLIGNSIGDSIGRIILGVGILPLVAHRLQHFGHRLADMTHGEGVVVLAGILETHQLSAGAIGADAAPNSILQMLQRTVSGEGQGAPAGTAGHIADLRLIDIGIGGAVNGEIQMGNGVAAAVTGTLIVDGLGGIVPLDGDGAVTGKGCQIVHQRRALVGGQLRHIQRNIGIHIEGMCVDHVTGINALIGEGVGAVTGICHRDRDNIGVDDLALGIGLQLSQRCAGQISGIGDGLEPVTLYQRLQIALVHSVVSLFVQRRIGLDFRLVQRTGIDTDGADIGIEVTAGHHVRGCAEGDLGLIGGLPRAILQIAVQRDGFVSIVLAGMDQRAVLIPLVTGRGGKLQRIGHLVDGGVANGCIGIDGAPGAVTVVGAEVVVAAHIGPDDKVVIDHTAGILAAAIGLELGNIGVSTGDAHNVVNGGAALLKVIQHELHGEFRAAQRLAHRVGQQNIVIGKGQIVGVMQLIGAPGLAVDLDDLAAAGQILPTGGIRIEAVAGVVIGIQMQHQTAGLIVLFVAERTVVAQLVLTGILCDLVGGQNVAVNADGADFAAEGAVGHRIGSGTEDDLRHFAGLCAGKGGHIRRGIITCRGHGGNRILIPRHGTGIVRDGLSFAVNAAADHRTLVMGRCRVGLKTGPAFAAVLIDNKVIVRRRGDGGGRGRDPAVRAGQRHNIGDLAAAISGVAHIVVHQKLDGKCTGRNGLADGFGQLDIAVHIQIVGTEDTVCTPSVIAHIHQLAAGGQIAPTGSSAVMLGADIVVGIQIQHQIIGDIAVGRIQLLGIVLLGIHCSILLHLSRAQRIGVDTDSTHLGIKEAAGNHIAGCAKSDLGLVGGLPYTVFQIAVQRDGLAGSLVGAGRFIYAILIPLAACRGAEGQRVGLLIQRIEAHRGIGVDGIPRIGTVAGAEAVGAAAPSENDKIVVNNGRQGLFAAAVGNKLGNIGIRAGDAHHIVDVAAVNEILQHEFDGEFRAGKGLPHGFGQQDIVVVKVQIVGTVGRIGAPGLAVDLDQLAAGSQILPRGGIGIKTESGVVVCIQMQHQIVSNVACGGCGAVDDPVGEEAQHHHQTQEQRKNSARPMILFHVFSP